MARRTPPRMPCRCGSGLLYARCCGPLHEGAPAPGAAALMRSRYCAYALERVDYLIQTTHPEGPHWQPDRARWRASLRDWCRATRFLGLELLAVDEALPQEEASVTFRATLSQGAQDISFTERSRFRRHEGRWKYLMAMETQ